MRYLVAGGAGFIGSHLVDKLIEKNHEVVVIDNLLSGKMENLAKNRENPSLSFVKRSITSNLELLFEAEKFDGVFHLAAIPRVQYSIEHPAETHDTNLNGTHNLLDLCRRFDVKRFVFSSSCAVYGNQEVMPLKEEMAPKPISPYALHKLMGEQYCALFKFLYQIEPVMLRYFNVYGPRQDPRGNYASLVPKFTKMINEGNSPTINGDGNQTRDFVYVADVVEANIAAANPENRKCIGEVINIGAGKSYSVNEVTSEILKISNSQISPNYGPSVVEPRNALADISKAKAILGWEPKYSLEKGLNEMTSPR